MRIGSLTTVLPQKKNVVNVLIFKTSINNKKQATKVAKLLNEAGDILRCNIDLQDVDRVLRVEAINVSNREIIAIMQKAGYFCEELTD